MLQLELRGRSSLQGNVKIIRCVGAKNKSSQSLGRKARERLSLGKNLGENLSHGIKGKEDLNLGKNLRENLSHGAKVISVRSGRVLKVMENLLSIKLEAVGGMNDGKFFF